MKPEERVVAVQGPALTGEINPLVPASPRGRGRPTLMSTAMVLERIRQLAGRREGLFRVHRAHPGLYARARRQFGSWAAAVHAAGVDYGSFLSAARRRSIDGRRRRRRSQTLLNVPPRPAGPEG